MSAAKSSGNSDETNKPFDNERYAFYRHLDDERAERLRSTVPKCLENDYCFVTEWFEDADGGISGVGVSYLDADVTVRLPLNVRPGLFVLSSDIPTLRAVASLHGYPNVIEFPNARYTSNNFTILNAMLRPESVLDATNCLCKIETGTFRDTVNLHRQLQKDNDSTSTYAVTIFWDATRQVMFELICVRLATLNTNFNVPQIIYRWFDRNLVPYTVEKPTIPMISFDIETVSTDPHRVPTGEDPDDVLFSVSVHHDETNTLYTLAYVPIDGESSESLRSRMLELDEYYEYPGQKNVVEVYTTEISLLRRTMALLKCTTPSGYRCGQRVSESLTTDCRRYRPYPNAQLNRRLHYLIGYNSLRYDMKYLMLRCQFYGLHRGEFVYKSGYSFGFDQIHIDMFCVARMRYNLSKYTLNNVSAVVLNDKKVDISAVALRYTFHHILDTQQLYAHGDPYMVANRMPSLRDTLHYNNRDTLLVTEIVHKTAALDYVFTYAHQSRIPMHSLNTNFNQIKYRLLSQCEVVAMERQMFFTTLKTGLSNLVAPMKSDTQSPKLYDGDALVADDYVCVVRNNESLLGGRMKSNGKQQRYPGGVNFCYGEFEVMDIQEYDYRIAYPMVMDRLNISDETCTIMRASDLGVLYPFVRNKHEYRCFDYVTHAGPTKTATKILIHQYLYNDDYCGGEFPFSAEQLEKRKTNPVIIVWVAVKKYQGVLSKIINTFNDMRESTKTKRSIIETFKSTIEEDLMNLQYELDLQDEQLENTTVQTMVAEEPRRLSFSTTNVAAFDDLVDPFSSDDDDDDNVPDETLFKEKIVTACDFDNVPEPFFSDDDDDDVASDGTTSNDTGKVNCFDDLLEPFGSDDDDGGVDDDSNCNDVGKQHDSGEKINNFDVPEPFESEDDDDDDDCVQLTNNDDSLMDPFSSDDEAEKPLKVDNKNDVDLLEPLSSDDDDDDDTNVGVNSVQVQCTTLKQAAEIVKTASETQVCQSAAEFEPMFSFKTPYITESYGGALAVTIPEDITGRDREKILAHLLELIMLEHGALDNLYLTLKPVVASIYGVIGRMKPEMAAAITCIIRTTLLTEARMAVKLGRTVYYCDTDSIHMNRDDGTDLSATFNKHFPYTEIEKKEKNRCMYVATKVYYTWPEGVIKYGANSKGPPMWRFMIEFFDAQSAVTTTADVLLAFEQFFSEVYRRVLHDSGPDGFDGFHSLTHDIKITNRESTIELKTYLSEHYKSLAGSFRQNVYYYHEDGSILKSIYRPSIEICAMDNFRHGDGSSPVKYRQIERLRRVNLFKFFFSSFKTVFNLLNYTVRKNNAPFNVTLNDQHVRYLMFVAYHNVYLNLFNHELPIPGKILNFKGIGEFVQHSLSSTMDSTSETETPTTIATVRAAKKMKKEQLSVEDQIHCALSNLNADRDREDDVEPTTILKPSNCGDSWAVGVD